MERGEVFSYWRWTEYPQGWVDAAMSFVKFVNYVGSHPGHVYKTRGAPTHEIDVFMEGFRDLLLDNMEMLSEDKYDVFSHPEAVIINTVFGPAYCDGFDMHQRYILLLKTM